MPATSSGATTMPAPVSRIRRAAAPSGGTTARIGRSAARYSNTFPESTPSPAAAGLRDQQQQRLGVALELERAAPRRVRRGARAGRRARASPRTRGRRCGSRRGSGRSRPRGRTRASAFRNGRGSRLPKKLPACVIRKRSDGWCSSPSKSSKSQPFAIVRTSPRGSSARASSAIASETATIASARRATSFATPISPCSLSRAAAFSGRRCGCAAERVAEVGDPAGAGRALGPRRRSGAPRSGGEVVSTTSMPCSRGRAGSRPGSRSGSRSRSRPGRAAAARTAARASTASSIPSLPVQLLGRLAAAAARRSAPGAPRPGVGGGARRRGGSSCGSSGASTCVSIPSAGRCVASLSGRCTPPPPAGGK